MTDDTTATTWSPQRIREAQFTQRRRGYDQDEVDAFLDRIAAQILRYRDTEASLRAEIARHQGVEASLRAEIERLQAQASNEDVQERAVDLFSQAQLVADQLIADAVQHAQDMMSAARSQEREILARASGATGSAPTAGGRAPLGDAGAEIGHVHTYAKIVAVQLRSVLDALSQEVDKLSAIPDRPAGVVIDGWGGGTVTRLSALDADHVPDDDEPLIWASMMPPPAPRAPGW